MQMTGIDRSNLMVLVAKESPLSFLPMEVHTPQPHP